MKYSSTLGGSTPEDVWSDWFESERGKIITGTANDDEDEEED